MHLAHGKWVVWVFRCVHLRLLVRGSGACMIESLIYLSVGELQVHTGDGG